MKLKRISAAAPSSGAITNRFYCFASVNNGLAQSQPKL
jgi:hypothetical protein